MLAVSPAWSKYPTKRTELLRRRRSSDACHADMRCSLAASPPNQLEYEAVLTSADHRRRQFAHGLIQSGFELICSPQRGNKRRARLLIGYCVCDQMSIFSAVTTALSTSMPRYLTVLLIFL